MHLSSPSSVIPPAVQLVIYERLLYVRMVEEALRAASLGGELKCPVHFSLGQEATAVGLGMHLKRTDAVVCTHRSHAMYLAKGGSLDAMIAEIYNKSTGCSGGTGGSMHLNEAGRGIFSSAIVGGAIPVAVGMALAAKMKKSNDVAVAFFGDGAAEEGAIHECLNFAALKKLPVVFFCENNFYAVEAAGSRTKANPRIADIARPWGIASMRIDGNDVCSVYAAAAQMVARARRGEGPGFIEAMTYRWLEHVGPHEASVKGYRPRGEIERWKKRCPVASFGRFLRRQGLLDAAVEAEMRRVIRRRIAAAWRRMRASPYPVLDKIEGAVCVR